MTAIITNKLKRQFVDQLFDDINSGASKYYIGIGRSEDWDSSDTPPTPINSEREIRNARFGIQAIKSAANVSFVVPRFNWSSGSIYSAYDDNQVGYPTNAYYVLTDENSVYMVVQQGKNAAGQPVTSTVKPTGTNTATFRTSDGYVWKYLYTIGALQGVNFTSANFIPVQKILDSAGAPGLSAIEVNQAQTQDAATAGEIVGVAVTKGGAGYTSAPSVAFLGNNTGKAAAATATVAGGRVVKIEMDDSGTGKALGAGYEFASVSITGGGGSGAEARAIISQDSGLGSDPRKDLRSFALMFNSKIDGAEGDRIQVGNDFRQTVLYKDPKFADSTGAFTGSVANTLNYLKITTINTPFTLDRTIQGGSSNAKAYVDFIDSSLIYYHQSEETGFGEFQEGETLTEVDGNGDGILEAAGVDSDSRAYRFPTVNPLSGEILYIDNRSPIERSEDQIEDIKIVVQL